MSIIQIVDVAGTLPINLMYRPHGFRVAFPGVRLAYFVAKLILEGREDWHEVVEALGRLLGLGIPSVYRHGWVRASCLL